VTLGARHSALGSPHARTHYAAFAALFAVGLWVGSFGPAMPFFADRFDVGLGTAGLIFTALATGSISASAGMTLRLRGADTRLVTAVGLAIAAIGLAALAVVPSLPLAIAACALIGIGDGLSVAGCHAMVMLTARDPAHDVNRLNIYFAVGAVVSPLWVGAALELTDELAVAYGSLAAVVAVICAYTWGAPETRGPDHTTAGRLVITPTILIAGFLLFLYVGAEIGLGAWVSSYPREAADTGVMAGAVVASGYWGALAAGRLVSARLLHAHHPRALLLRFIIAAGLSSTALAIFGGILPVAFACAAITGLAFGPIWPLTMAIGAHDTTPGTTAAMVTLGNSGAVIFPWAQGLVLAEAGASEGVAVTAALCALMLAVSLTALREHQAQPTPVP
jgi:fucose permease